MAEIIYFKSEGKMTSEDGSRSLWEENCLPIGNAYMGATMFGGVREERIVLNEKSLWAGGPCERRPDYCGGNKRDRYQYVKQVQDELSAGNYDKVLELLPELTGDGDFGSYQVLCRADFSFKLPDGEPQNYIRQLDLAKSLYTCEFDLGGVHYARDAFASYPARTIVFGFSADKAGALAFDLRLNDTHVCEISLQGDTLVYSGHVWDNDMRFDARFKISTDGKLSFADGVLSLSEATTTTIYFSAATDYAMTYPDYRSGLAPETITAPLVNAAAEKGFAALYDEHYADYSAIYSRVSLTLGSDTADLPADELLKAYRAGDRAAMNRLETLYFCYGRYLLISSSREGALPANLQGVWNESFTPPWCCDYHINVNLQMNYWNAYNTNMAETARPLVDFLNSLREPGRVTAKEYYNIVSDEAHPENGWTAHTQCSPFGWTAPGWDFYWGWSTAAVAWLMQNIWEYYEFTGDIEYLRNAVFPIMRESVTFYTQWLKYDEKQQRLVSTPTYSPEHGPATIGNTYEQSLIEQLFFDFLAASEALGEEGELQEKVRGMLPQLKPYHVSRTGLLKEWFEEDEPDFDRSKVQKNHRHISHLMGLYPGKQINHGRPELMEAAIATMNDRGDESTGWARAYKINLWARTGDGNRAYKLLRGLLESCTFNNLWDFHPPFQIDGNFGASAGIAEMLIQSHEGVIKLLPALPDEWSSGEFTGLCARGGFVVDAKWENGVITSAVVTSEKGGAFQIILPMHDGETLMAVGVGAGESVKLV